MLVKTLNVTIQSPIILRESRAFLRFDVFFFCTFPVAVGGKVQKYISFTIKWIIL